MGKWKTYALGVLAALVAVCTADAQTITVSPDPILTAGGTAEITFDAGAEQPPGTSVTIYIDNGGHRNPLSETVEIELDAEGRGSATWNVPSSGWSGANFNGGGAPNVTRGVSGGSTE